MTPVVGAADLPSFENPPVVEVVCGIQFDPLQKFYVPHFGELWRRFPEYTDCEEAPPLLPTIERFGTDSPTDGEQFADLPLPRVWFQHRRRSGLIQVQRDRFLHNWKKAQPTDAYPRYQFVKKLFQEHLATFRGFVSDLELGQFTPRQYEMTYVNHILRGEGWQELADLGKVFPDFAWNGNPKRFLVAPTGEHLRLNFIFPDKTARLHTTIRSAARREDGHPLISFELTVRGMAPDDSEGAMWHWFDTARRWIVRGFVDLTAAEIQETIWKRTR